MVIDVIIVMAPTQPSHTLIRGSSAGCRYIEYTLIVLIVFTLLYLPHKSIEVAAGFVPGLAPRPLLVEYILDSMHGDMMICGEVKCLEKQDEADELHLPSIIAPTWE